MNQPKEYRKKPVVIKAMKFDVNNGAEIVRWMENFVTDAGDNFPGEILIRTLEGVMSAKPGDYIVQGVAGEFYPCKPDFFEATYDSVGEEK